LLAEDGYRESAESWKAVLRELKRRGLVAPVLAVGDGALGFWTAAREVWLETGEQGCWCHKLCNVLYKLPQRLHSRAKRALHEMMYAARRSDCEAAGVRFAAEYQAKYPKAVESLTELGASGPLLRFSSRALEASTYHQRDRICIRHRALA
jgi:putative transposase